MPAYIGHYSMDAPSIALPTMTNGLDGWDAIPFTQPTREMALLSASRQGPRAFGTLVMYPRYARAGGISEGIGRTFYGGVILTPTTLSLGLVLTAKYYSLSLWNLTGYDQKMLDWHINGLDNTTLANSDGYPVRYGPRGYREYLLTIGASGGSQLIGGVAFHFEGMEALTTSITGTRLVVFAFEPNWRDAPTESLEWMTDVIDSYNGSEQRLSLRQFPRRALKYLFTMETKNKVSTFESYMFGWQAKVFALPVWTDLKPLAANVPVGSTTAAIYTAFQDYSVGGMLIFWRDYQTWEVLDIDSLTASAITFKKPTTMPWRIGDRVAPARLARLGSTVQVSRPNASVAETTLDWFYEVSGAICPNRLGNSTWPQYQGLDVLTLIPNGIDSEDVFSCALETVDVGKGAWATYGHTDCGVPITRPYRWLLKSRQEIANFLAFLETRRGRHIPFWMPSWSQDMESIQVVGPSDTTLLIKNIAYTQIMKLHPNRRDLVFYFSDNSAPMFRHITGCSDPSNGTEVIAMDASLGKLVYPRDFRGISFLNYVRLDSDSVEITWISASSAEVTFRVREVMR